MADKSGPSFPLNRASYVIRLAPGLLGFSALVNPDTKFNDEGDFTARCHFNEAQQAMLAAQVQKEIDALLPGLQKLADEWNEKAGRPKKALKVPTGAGWLEDKLSPPKEGARIQLPSIQIKCAASFVSKRGDTAGQTINKTLKAYDNAGTLLDLGKLRTGMGSVIQLVASPALYTNAQSKGYAEVSMRLEGIVVLKNEPWGVGQGGNSGDEMSEDEIAKLVGDDFQVDGDLAQFAGAKASWAPGDPEDPQAPKEKVLREEYDLNDDIPF